MPAIPWWRKATEALSDAELLRRTARRDDSEAFGIFYRRYQGPLIKH